MEIFTTRLSIHRMDSEEIHRPARIWHIDLCDYFRGCPRVLISSLPVLPTALPALWSVTTAKAGLSAAAMLIGARRGEVPGTDVAYWP